MKSKIFIFILLTVIISDASAFTHKRYKNYNTDAVSDFISGIYSGQLANTEKAEKYYERAYRYSKSDHIMLNLGLEYIMSKNYDEGYKILNDLFDRGFKLGRAGIYLYLNESKIGNKSRSAAILERIISELQESGDIVTSAIVLNQKLDDNLFSFTSFEQFDEFLNSINEFKYSSTFRLYFDSIAMQFYSRTSGDSEKITGILTGLEKEYPELPYIAYRFAFDEFIFLKSYEKAEEVLNKMNKYTLNEAKFYSDKAEFYSSKGDFKSARNLLLDGMKEFPESTLNLQLAELYISNNDVKKADKIYSGVITKYPEGSTYIYQMMANEYSGAGKNEEAFSAYERGLKENPDDPELLNNYAYQLAQSSKDLEKALEYVNKALAGKEDLITFLDTKPGFFIKWVKPEEAEKIMDEIFLNENSFYHSSSEELFGHYKEIKSALNKSGELEKMSLNKTAVLLKEIVSKSNIILQVGF